MRIAVLAMLVAGCGGQTLAIPSGACTWKAVSPDDPLEPRAMTTDQCTSEGAVSFALARGDVLNFSMSIDGAEIGRQYALDRAAVSYRGCTDWKGYAIVFAKPPAWDVSISAQSECGTIGVDVHSLD